MKLRQEALQSISSGGLLSQLSLREQRAEFYGCDRSCSERNTAPLDARDSQIHFVLPMNAGRKFFPNEDSVRSFHSVSYRHAGAAYA
jgi:hypothetical protein